MIEDIRDPHLNFMKRTLYLQGLGRIRDRQSETEKARSETHRDRERERERERWPFHTRPDINLPSRSNPIQSPRERKKEILTSSKATIGP